MMEYVDKQAVSVDQFVYVRLRKSSDDSVISCKVRKHDGMTKDALLKQQFGDHITIKWTAEDHAEVKFS